VLGAVRDAGMVTLAGDRVYRLGRGHLSQWDPQAAKSTAPGRPDCRSPRDGPDSWSASRQRTREDALLKNLVRSLARKLEIVVERRSTYRPGVDLYIDVERLFPDEDLLVFDIGANVGQFAMETKRALPKARVESFEPIPSSFERLVGNVAQYSDVTCHRIAFSDRTGTVQMSAEPFDDGNRIITGAGNEAGEAVATVEASTLDDYLERNPVPFIHLLKTDTEGHDLNVLKGAEQTLRSNKVGVIQSEVTFYEDNHDLCQFTDIANHLSELDMRFVGVTSTWCMQDRPSRIAWGDAMFASEAVLRRASPRPDLWD
jgi:FkbM family methyltransferase